MLAQKISDVLPRNINKIGEPAASDFSDSGAQDLTAGSTLKVVEPIFRAGAAPGAETLETGEDASTFKASRDLVGMRTAWYSVEGRLVYRKEEVNIFARDSDARNPRVPPRLTELFAQDLSYFRLLTIVREAADADRGEILIGSKTLPQLVELSNSVRRQGNCGLDEGCLMAPKGAFISPLIAIEVNKVEKLVPPNTQLSEVLLSSYANLRIWKPYHGRLLAVDFRKAGSAILKLPLTGGERIHFTQKP
jgi:hypothetical protein